MTSFSLAKMRWIISHEEFRRSPLRVLCGILSWEMTRILGKPRVLKFDRSLHLCVGPNDGTGRLITYFGFHEPGYFQFLDSFLKPGMTFIDIGANIGAYTVFAAKRVRPNGSVFAFEPDPENFEKLEINMRLNNLTNIFLFRKALSDKDGEISIQWHEDSARRSLHHSATYEQPSVQALCLDRMLERLPSVINYMKIDTAGFELFVLRGASDVLSSRPPGIIQLEMPKNAKEVAALLRTYGYELFDLVKRDGSYGLVKCRTIPYRMLAIHNSLKNFHPIEIESF